MLSDVDGDSSDSDYDTDDEAFPEPIPANLSPIPGEDLLPGQPAKLDIQQQILFTALLITKCQINLQQIRQSDRNVTADWPRSVYGLGNI